MYSLPQSQDGEGAVSLPRVAERGVGEIAGADGCRPFGNRRAFFGTWQEVFQMPARRKPNEMHILDGTFRADRHGDPSEAVVAEGEPLPPAWLKGEALAFWSEVVPQVVQLRVARAIDAPELASLCEWWARTRKLSRKVDRLAVGTPRYGTALRALVAAFATFDRLASRFGLTPGDRARLRVQEKAKTTGVQQRERKA
jgi:phage terminase small subunit